MSNYLESIRKQFEYYKSIGEKAIEQVSDEQLFTSPNEESNSIATIVQHLWGNMLSRWTDFLTTDGEKPWRKRDEEFEPKTQHRTELIQKWNAGWEVLFKALSTLKEEDLNKIIYIRNQGHTVMEALNRQLAHYPYHIGQIVFLSKMYASANWKSLSIPKGQSTVYNQEKFAEAPSKKHFTDEWLNKGSQK